MSTMTPDYTKLRDFLAGKKQASAKGASDGMTNIEIAGEEGAKSPSTGARFSEHTSDVKEVVPSNSIESSAGNEAMGNAADPVPHSNLEQTTSGQDDSQTRAIKKINGETEKMSSLDLSKDADLAAAFASLQKAAAALPGLLATSGVQQQLTAKQAAEYTAWNAEQQAIANTVDAYRKMGADRGRMTACFLRGFEETQAFLKAAADDGTLAQMTAGGGGEMPPEALPEEAGAMPADAGAAAPPADAPPDGGEGGGHISPDDLVAAFAEAGITPEELLQILQHMKGGLGGAGGDPTAAGGMPPEMPPEQKAAAAAAIAQAEKIAYDAKAHQRSGRFSFKPAADGTPSRRSRDVMKAYLAEICAAGA